jgi:16S rRNA (adenine1518-N6/adenine1519-N6)-dimethyltransferase
MQDEKDFYLKPKKSLGQHFLRSEKALLTMVEGIGPSYAKASQDKNDFIIFEIGPGEGVLTEKLLEKGFTVISIEIDKRSIEILKEKFAKYIRDKKFSIIESDCLEVGYGVAEGRGGYILVGNIPYYITGAIFRHTFEQKNLPEQAIFLIQKEVAQRIVARDGKESLLSVSVKIFGSTKILDIVKAGSFVPPPKVDSAIISIENIVSPFKNQKHYEKFFAVLKAAFSHKRKLLLANLKTDLDKEIFEKYFEGIKNIIISKNGEKARAEDVSLETWKEIIEIL